MFQEYVFQKFIFETLWGPSHDHFYKIYKTYRDSLVKIEKRNLFLLSEQQTWQPYML